MDRLQFFKTSATASVLLKNLSLSAVFPGVSLFQSRLNSQDFKNFEMEDISPALQNKINKLFNIIILSGWFKYAAVLDPELDHKFDLSKLTINISQTNIDKVKKMSGFEDFRGTKWIEPGYPAQSLMYHMLASPRVRPDKNIFEIQYLDLPQIDLLEDYIFALQKWDTYKKNYQIESDEEIVLAVFAYEYRTAYKTPHHLCADLVFSRTGIGRIGNKEIRFDSINRCYTNNPSLTGSDRNAAVTPARFGLFASVKRKYDLARPVFDFMKMQEDKGGDINFIGSKTNLDFLVPFRKIFQDDILIDSANIVFQEYHESRKNAILMSNESYTRESKELVQSKLLTSSFLISSIPREFIRPLKDKSGKLVVFDAPLRTGGNRYFSTYYNTNISSVSEFIEVYINSRNSRIANTYNANRNGPMYVNLTHYPMDNTPIAIERSPLGSDGIDGFNDKINEARPVCVFEDNICDGYVTATISTSAKNSLSTAISRGVLKAFSIVTAPDFFPQADEFDMQRFDIAPGSGNSTLFYEGGISSLANISIPPNPIVTKDDLHPSLNPVKTYTTVISNHVAPASISFERPDEVKGYFFSSFLPDMCSGVFSPGWDITYSNNGSRMGAIFLSTQGLGSPFVEDMKLCAAMNGMWPAASPDAARTYQASVTDINSYKRNPTAVPLMDDEIGVHEMCAAHADHGHPISFGWDGEQGPFLEQAYDRNQKGPYKWYINFTDLSRADYVQNTLKNMLDFSKLRSLDSRELNLRMKCLKSCLQRLKVTDYPNAHNDLWLVSAQKVNWDTAIIPQGIPKSLLGTNTSWVTERRRALHGEGYIYLFSSYIPNEDDEVYWMLNGINTKRRRVLCNRLYLCRVTETNIDYYALDASLTNIYSDANWQ